MPDAIRGLGNAERDQPALTMGFKIIGNNKDSISKRITTRPGLLKAILVIRKKIACFVANLDFS